MDGAARLHRNRIDDEEVDMLSHRTTRFLNTGLALAALSVLPLGLAAQHHAPQGGPPCPMGAMTQADGKMGGGMMSGGGMMGGGGHMSGVMMGGGMMRGGAMEGADMGGMMGGMHGMMSSLMMGGVITYQPQRVLALRDTLELTTQQVRQLEGLTSDDRTARDGAAEDAMRELEAALEAERPDTTAVRAAAERAFRLAAARHTRDITQAAAARSILTDVQRDRLAAVTCPRMDSSGGSTHDQGGHGH